MNLQFNLNTHAHLNSMHSSLIPHFITRPQSTPPRQASLIPNLRGHFTLCSPAPLIVATNCITASWRLTLDGTSRTLSSVNSKDTISRPSKWTPCSFWLEIKLRGSQLHLIQGSLTRTQTASATGQVKRCGYLS